VQLKLLDLLGKDKNLLGKDKDRLQCLEQDMRDLREKIEQPTAAGGCSPTSCLPLRSLIGLPRRVVLDVCRASCSSPRVPWRFGKVSPPCAPHDPLTVTLPLRLFLLIVRSFFDWCYISTWHAISKWRESVRL
jgi:hypothetical protein